MKVTLELIYEELQKLATKEELAELEQRMDRRFMRQFAYFTKLNKQTVESFEARMDKQDDRINAILDKYEGRLGNKHKRLFHSRSLWYTKSINQPTGGR